MNRRILASIVALLLVSACNANRASLVAGSPILDKTYQGDLQGVAHCASQIIGGGDGAVAISPAAATINVVSRTPSVTAFVASVEFTKASDDSFNVRSWSQKTLLGNPALPGEQVDAIIRSCLG